MSFKGIVHPKKNHNLFSITHPQNLHMCNTKESILFFCGSAFFKIPYFSLCRRQKAVQIWNDVRMSNDERIFIFWVNCSLKGHFQVFIRWLAFADSFIGSSALLSCRSLISTQSLLCQDIDLSALLVVVYYLQPQQSYQESHCWVVRSQPTLRSLSSG